MAGRVFERYARADEQWSVRLNAPAAQIRRLRLNRRRLIEAPQMRQPDELFGVVFVGVWRLQAFRGQVVIDRRRSRGFGMSPSRDLNGRETQAGKLCRQR